MFELDRVRTRRHPPASIAIGALTLIVFAIEVARFGPSPTAGQLLSLGASEREAIWRHHELWRLLCPAFLHAGLVHILMNGYSFVLLATFIERIWGSARFLVLYVVSAIAGVALSSRNPGVISVGASGAIFGLVGFLLGASYLGRHRHEVRTIVQKTWGQGLLISVGGMFAYGMMPGTHIDNWAHVGGLLAGGALGLVLVETDEADAPLLAMGGAAALAIVAAWGAFFLDARQEKRFEQLFVAAINACDRHEWADAVQDCEQALLLRPHHPAASTLCHIEGLAELRSGHLDEAGYALERAWRTQPSAEVAALLVEVSLAKKDAKAAHAWLEQCGRQHGERESPELQAELDFLARNAGPEIAAVISTIRSND